MGGKVYLWTGHLLVYGCIDVLQGQLRHRSLAMVCSCCASFCCSLPKVRLKARAPVLLPSNPSLSSSCRRSNVLQASRKAITSRCHQWARFSGLRHVADQVRDSAANFDRSSTRITRNGHGVIYMIRACNLLPWKYGEPGVSRL